MSPRDREILRCRVNGMRPPIAQRVLRKLVERLVQEALMIGSEETDETLALVKHFADELEREYVGAEESSITPLKRLGVEHRTWHTAGSGLPHLGERKNDDARD